MFFFVFYKRHAPLCNTFEYIVPERCTKNTSHKKTAQARDVSGNVQDKKGNELIRALNALRQQGVAPLVGCVQQQPRGHAQAFEKHETRRKKRHTPI
jgi:hypothetical protein